jgi:hypothetical protein
MYSYGNEDNTHVKVRLDLRDRLVYHTTTESHAMSAESRKPRNYETTAIMEIVNSFPAGPMKMCALPNQDPRSLIPNIDNPKTLGLSNPAQSDTCGLPFACAVTPMINL